MKNYKEKKGLIEENWCYLKDNEDWYPKGFNVHTLPMFIQAVCAVVGVGEVNDVKYKDLVCFTKNNYFLASYDIRDMRKFSKYFLEKSKTNWINEYLYDFRNKTKEFSSFCESIHNKLDKTKLKEIFVEFLEKIYATNSYGYVTEATAMTKDEYWVTKHLKELKSDLTDDEMVKILTPHFKSYVIQYEQDLQKLSNDNIKKKWYWIKTSYYATEELTDELIEKDRSSKHIEPLKAVDLSSYSEEIRQFADFISKLTQLQDERKKNAMTSNYILNKLLTAISDEHNVSIEVLQSCLPNEIIDFLEGKQLDIEEANKRREYCAWVLMDEGFEVTTDFETVKRIEELLEDNKETITGYCACKGKVTGKVKIILSEDDFHKMEEDNILVTSMTRPEFTTIMKKSSAIITNEGGITCHAAILSRELNKPCIIGTNVATKILKDNDLVEVDANKGTVRKL